MTRGGLTTTPPARPSFRPDGRFAPKDEARAVLARPFLDASLEASADSVSELARAADDYPYFLQLCGAATWDAVKASGARDIRSEHDTANYPPDREEHIPFLSAYR